MDIERISQIEKDYVIEVLSTSFRGSKYVGMVGAAEKAFSNLIDCEYSIGFVNGTSTLHAALETLGVGIGDEVIIPPLTMSATMFAVLQANATPVFADIDSETFQISAESIKAKITNRTKAVITVALFGGSPEYKDIMKVCGNIPIIEDNAEAVGTTYHGRSLGTFGSFSSYSFQSSKHLTSGEGGMLCTNDFDLADRVRKIQSLGYAAVGASSNKINKVDIQNPDYSRHVSLGWNYRMTELVGAVVRGQIERSKELIDRRKHVASEIINLIDKCSWLTPQKNPENSENSFWSAAILLQSENISWQEFRDKFMSFGGKGIYAAWKLGYLEPAIQNRNLLGRERLIERSRLEEYRIGLCPVAERIQPRILSFRTNEWSDAGLNDQLQALRKTIDFFD